MAINAPSRTVPSVPPGQSQPVPSLRLQDIEKEELQLGNELWYTADFFRARLFANSGHRLQNIFCQLFSNQPLCKVKEFQHDHAQSTEEVRRSTIEIQRMLSHFEKRVCAFRRELSRHDSEASGMEELGHTRQRKLERASLSHCFVALGKVKCTPKRTKSRWRI